jgi:cell division septum initiation protein DivIVA
MNGGNKMANNIEELISSLYEIIQSAWSIPLGQDKCVIERDKVLDLLDEISAQLPGELKQAKTIVESRNEVITNAKREAENILRQAEQRAKTMISDEEVYRQAKEQSAEMIRSAQNKIKELRQVTSDYVENALKRTEDAIASSLAEVKESHAQFTAMTNPQPKAPSPIIEDI